MVQSCKDSFLKSLRSIWNIFPILLGVILLIGLVNSLIPIARLIEPLQGNFFLDPVIGSLAGSILAGNPINSYVLGGEMLDQGVDLLVVTAFLISWVTVGFIQITPEALILGKRFTVTRNITAFILSILGALVTVVLVG